MMYDLGFAVASVLLLLTLYFSSVEDMKYHRISKKYVIAVFLIVMIYNNIAGSSVEATVSFLMTLGIFGAITALSRGGFGFGDTIVLGALGWYIGSLIHLQYFFLTLAFSMLILGGYFVVKNHKNNHKKWNLFFNNKEFVKVKNLKVGMILCEDYFMKGLTEKEIEDLQKKNDPDNGICVKQAYPFIPVIFLSFLVYVIMIFAEVY